MTLVPISGASLANPPWKLALSLGGSRFSGANMKRCQIPIFAKLHDDETDADYLVPIKPVKCPFCGKEKTNG